MHGLLFVNSMRIEKAKAASLNMNLSYDERARPFGVSKANSNVQQLQEVIYGL